MVLKTLERTGALHRSGIARQIEQTSADLLNVNCGTLYPVQLKLEQKGCITSQRNLPDNHRNAKDHETTRLGRNQVEKETQDWDHTAVILTRFVRLKEGPA